LQARQKRERDLARGDAARIGNAVQHLAIPAARRGEIIVAERRISDDGNAVPLALPDHSMLDRALLQMIKHLVASDPALARDRQQFAEIVGIEIAAPHERTFPSAVS
jgi:hypothetical protein